jgi:hypothetical protein
MALHLSSHMMNLKNIKTKNPMGVVGNVFLRISK